MADEQTLDQQNLDANQAAEAGADDLAARVKTLEEQLAAAQDQSLRVAADLQNVRRRADLDVEKAHKFALDKFSTELLPVADSLVSALEMSSDTDEKLRPMREGMQLTLKVLEAAFAKFGIESLNPEGERFNPQFHQAMAEQPAADVEPGVVLKVFQRGYQLNGRLLRPAMVVVSKAAAPVTPSIDEQA
ncbi:nucleotide exchange factor GrpE [Pseudomonas putida]